MLIRNFTINDYDNVYTLWEQTDGLQLDPLDDSKSGIAHFLEKNPSTSFVALVNDAIVGAVLCGSDGRRGYIYHAVVQSDFQNQGVASQLMEYVFAALKDLGIHKSALLVFNDNQKGNCFWDKMNYIPKNNLIYKSRSL